MLLGGTVDAACASKAGCVIFALNGMSTSLDRETFLHGEALGGRSGLRNIGVAEFCLCTRSVQDLFGGRRVSLDLGSRSKHFKTNCRWEVHGYRIGYRQCRRAFPES